MCDESMIEVLIGILIFVTMVGICLLSIILVKKYIQYKYKWEYIYKPFPSWIEGEQIEKQQIAYRRSQKINNRYQRIMFCSQGEYWEDLDDNECQVIANKINSGNLII